MFTLKRATRIVLGVLLTVTLAGTACGSSESTQSESQTVLFSYQFNSGNVFENSDSYTVYKDGTLIKVDSGYNSDRVDVKQAQLTDDQVSGLIANVRKLGLASKNKLDLGNAKRELGLVSYYYRNSGEVFRHSFQYAISSDSEFNQSQSKKRSELRKKTSGLLDKYGQGSFKDYQATRTAVILKQVDDDSKRKVSEWSLSPLGKAQRWKDGPNGYRQCLVLPSNKTKGLVAKEERAQRIAERRDPGGLVEVNPLYRSGDKLYDVRFHPLLPDEESCSSVKPYFVPPEGASGAQ